MIRLFVALRPPPEMRRLCLDAMERGPAGWAWQDDEQLHVTLRFVGEVERPVAEDVAVALGSLHAQAVQIRLSGVGWFDHGPRGALFARVGPKEPLEALHDKIDRLLVRAGLEPERRAFLPHITLARRRRGADDPAAWLERHAGLSSDPMSCPHVTLYQSHLGRGGSTYEAVERFPLLG